MQHTVYKAFAKILLQWMTRTAKGMIYVIWQSAMERRERADNLVNLREVTKRGAKKIY